MAKRGNSQGGADKSSGSPPFSQHGDELHLERIRQVTYCADYVPGAFSGHYSYYYNPNRDNNTITLSIVLLVYGIQLGGKPIVRAPSLVLTGRIDVQKKAVSPYF